MEAITFNLTIYLPTLQFIWSYYVICAMITVICVSCNCLLGTPNLRDLKRKGFLKVLFTIALYLPVVPFIILLDMKNMYVAIEADWN